MAARTTSPTAANVETHARYERRSVMRKPAIREVERAPAAAIDRLVHDADRQCGDELA
jgi:hypothetical protein